MTEQYEHLRVKIARLEQELKRKPKFQGEFKIIDRAIAKAKRRLKEQEQPELSK